MIQLVKKKISVSFNNFYNAFHSISLNNKSKRKQRAYFSFKLHILGIRKKKYVEGYRILFRWDHLYFVVEFYLCHIFNPGLFCMLGLSDAFDDQTCQKLV